MINGKFEDLGSNFEEELKNGGCGEE